jgi:SAM-dependent methyltransferase
VSAYGDDLAYIHDVGFGNYAEVLAPGLLALLRDNGISDGLVVDLGCGSGIWARRLTDAGYEVVGVDISPAMIRLARRRAPEAAFHAKSFLAFQFPRCRAVTAFGEVLCYLFDAQSSDKALASLFERVTAALEPGGLLVFDVPEVGLDKGRPPTFREGEDWACLVRFDYDDGAEQLTRRITTFRKVGTLYRRQEEAQRLQLYRRGQISKMLRQAGLRVRTVRRIGAAELLPGRVGFIARKP